MRPKVLIIGASGLLGSKLMELGKNKYDLYGTYNTQSLSGSNFFKLDVSKREEVFKLINNIKPELVIDTHSITNVDYCETHKDEAWNVNVNSLYNIAETCKILGCKLVFISTDYVFDGKKLSYGEEDKVCPVNYYGCTKVIGEKILDDLNVNHIITRTTVLYGVGMSNKKTFVNWVLENLQAGKEIKVVIDQFNKPTLVDDLAKVICELYELGLTGLFHAFGSDYINRYDFAVKIAKTFGLNKNLIKPITSEELNQIAPRPKKLDLSTKKLEQAIRRKLVGVDEGLKIVKEQMVV